jgi:hypothetical protein
VRLSELRRSRATVTGMRANPARSPEAGRTHPAVARQACSARPLATSVSVNSSRHLKRTARNSHCSNERPSTDWTLQSKRARRGAIASESRRACGLTGLRRLSTASHRDDTARRTRYSLRSSTTRGRAEIDTRATEQSVLLVTNIPRVTSHRAAREPVRLRGAMTTLCGAVRVC